MIAMDAPDPVHARILRSLSPDARWATWQSLHRTARHLLRAAVLAAHPDWEDERIEREISRRILHARP